MAGPQAGAAGDERPAIAGGLAVHEILVGACFKMKVSSTFAASDGAEYEIQMGRWSRRLAEPFLDFTGTADDEEVLDVGCGTGNLAFAIAQRASVKSIKGIDFSGPYVENAKSHNRSPQITFEAGDATALPYDDASFDRVLSMLVLFFIPDAKKAVSEMKRVARSGSTVAATLWDARGGMMISRMFVDTAAVLDTRANELRARACTRPLGHPGDLGRAWHDAGLREVKEATLIIRMEFANFDDYWRPYMGGQGPYAEYVGSLKPDEQATLKHHVRRAYLDGEPDGHRSYAAVAMAVKGTKA
jgi:SAM-dependent methyltransferase